MKLYSLETEKFKADGGAMFGVVPKAMWERIYPADENNLCKCACRSLLIDDGERKILIDTGIGQKLDYEYAKHHYLFEDDNILKSLKKIGIKPDEITDIILTHLHFDHCGGTSELDENGNNVLSFKNANIWVSKAQWDWAIHPNRREKPAYLSENLEPIQASGKMKFIHENMFLTPEVELRIFNGHTEGLVSVFINIGNRRLVFAGDLLPAKPYIRMSFIASYDIQPLVSIQEKELLLKEMLENDDILFLQHDYYSEACSLKMTPKGIRENKNYKINELV
jgi:glyoxylase-like metal-dependent hydrolase (beta-lactamase superfamily II)